MTFFMRLEVGKDLYAFEGSAPHVCYKDILSQADAIKNFMEDIVIPALDEIGFITNPEACFGIKAVSNIVENDGGDFFTWDDENKIVFTLMDMVIAIDRKMAPCP